MQIGSFIRECFFGDKFYKNDVWYQIRNKLKNFSFKEKRKVGDGIFDLILKYTTNYTFVPDVSYQFVDIDPSLEEDTINYYYCSFPIETHLKSITIFHDLFKNKCNCEKHQHLFQNFKDLNNVVDDISLSFLNNINIHQKIKTSRILAKEHIIFEIIKHYKCPFEIYDYENEDILENIISETITLEGTQFERDEKEDFIDYDSVSKFFKLKCQNDNLDDDLETLLNKYKQWIISESRICEKTIIISQVCYNLLSYTGTTNDYFYFYNDQCIFLSSSIKDNIENLLFVVFKRIKYRHSNDFKRIPKNVVENNLNLFKEPIVLTKLKNCDKQINFDKITCMTEFVDYVLENFE